MQDERQQLEELKKKKKLTGLDRAQIKVLERKIKQQHENAKTSEKPQPNVFATKPTTSITPLPIRFSKEERIGLSELANDIKSNHIEAVISELGSERDINETKLVRAAIYLLKQFTHQEIIQAIRQVKLNMIR